MEEFIDCNYAEIFERIRRVDPISQYAACSKFLDLIRPYFCQAILHNTKQYFFRVRTHPPNSGSKFYFTNVSEISYRTDFFNITSYGRCNCPFETIFYCSDDPRIAFLEVTDLAKSLNLQISAYHTTGVWKMNKELYLSPIFENRFLESRNERLMNLTLECLNVIDSIKNYSKKEQLKEFHKLIGYEFIKDFAPNQDIYLISSAVSNYLMYSPNNEKTRIEGLVYPCCVRTDAIRGLALNYAFDPCIIGFGNKLELSTAYRSKVELGRDGYYHTELLQCKKVNTYTGEIVW